jgi:hypothetical protein
MARLMPVAFTEAAVRNRTKAVTRRTGCRFRQMWRPGHAVPEGDGPQEG